MKNNISIDEEYKRWIAQISKRYRSSQIKASITVNRELLSFYWSLGKDIYIKKAISKYGNGFFDKMSKDLKRLLPGTKGFASSNLRYMAKFYELYHFEVSDEASMVTDADFPQVVGKLITDDKQLSNNTGNTNLPQVVGKLTIEELFSVPWGHHRVIIDACKGDSKKAIFFIRKTIDNNPFFYFFFASHRLRFTSIGAKKCATGT